MINDWSDLKNKLIWAFLVNLFIGIGIIAQMYYNQKLIMYRLEQLEANQKSITIELMNLYKNDR